MTNETKKQSLFHEFYFFKSSFIIATFFVYAYFPIFLYKYSNSFTIIVIDSIVFYLTAWIGFIIGSFIIEKLGYVSTFRLSFFLQAVATTFVLFNSENILNLFILFGILRGLPRGMFWSVNHIYVLKEFNQSERNLSINIIESLGHIFNIVFPVLTGALITLSGNYNLSFIIGIAILLITSVAPFNYNKKPKSQITSNEIMQIIKHPLFSKFSFITIIHQGIESLTLLTFTIIPFLFIGNEFGIGILATGINIFAALLLFTRRKNKIDKDVKLGYLGHLIYTISNLMLIFAWIFEVYVLRNIISIVGNVLTENIKQKMEFSLREKILAHNKNSSSIEMNLVMETLYFIGRMVAASTYLVCLVVFNIDLVTSFKIILGLQTVWVIIHFVSLQYFLRNHTIEESSEMARLQHQHNGHLFGGLHH